MIIFELEGAYHQKPLSPENMGIEFLKNILNHLPGKLVSKNSSITIEKRSACLKISEELEEEGQQTFGEIIDLPDPLAENKVIKNIINFDKKENFDPEWNAELKQFQTILKKHDINCIISADNVAINKTIGLSLNKDTSILTDEDLWHQTQKYIYGEIIDIGGKFPNMHVEDEAGRKIKIDINKTEIQKISNNILYKKKCICIACEEHEFSKDIRECQFISWDDYDPDYVRENFEQYRKERENIFQKSWDVENIKKNYDNDNDKWLNEVRHGE